jgi:hypothetical protein
MDLSQYSNAIFKFVDWSRFTFKTLYAFVCVDKNDNRSVAPMLIGAKT